MSIYLSALTPTIINKEHNIYEVIYKTPQYDNTPPYTGSCTYTKWKSKLQPNGCYVLTNCDMGDIISYINMSAPLNEGDLLLLQQDIREHSLYCLSIYPHQ